MADGRGGYQRPRNPAPASGPGRLSRRTDRQPIRALSDAAYGEQATYRADQQGAPMAQAPSATQVTSQAPAGPTPIVPLGADTQYPNEPVTAGAASGGGPGIESLGLPVDSVDGNLEYVRSVLPMLELAASLPSAGPAFRQFVRRVRGSAP